MDKNLLNEVVRQLAAGKTLPARNKDHLLKGHYKGFRECHIQPDWLLIYKIEHEEKVLNLIRTGSHEDLFG